MNTNSINITEAFNELSAMECHIKQIEFIQNAMYDIDGSCTPAALLELPLERLKLSIKSVEDFLKSVKR
jgi:hypothetical protein